MILGEIGGASIEVYVTSEGEYVDLEVRLVGKYGGASARTTAWALLIDTSKSMKEMGKLRHAVDAARRLIESMPDHDLISVYTFDEKVKTIIPFTRVADVRGRIGKLYDVKVGSYTMLYEALLKVIDDINKGRSSLFRGTTIPPDAQKVIVVITDGEPWPTYTEERYYEALGRNASSLGIVINAIGIGEDYNEKILYKLTSASGGTWYHIKNLADIGDVLLREFARVKAAALRKPKVTITPYNCQLVDAKRLARTIAALGPVNTVEFPDIAGGEAASALFRLKPTGEWWADIAVTAEEGSITGRVDSKSAGVRDKTVALTQVLTQVMLEAAETGVVRTEPLRVILEDVEAPEHLKTKALALMEKASADRKELLLEATTFVYPAMAEATKIKAPPPSESPPGLKAKCVIRCLETGKEMEVEAPIALGRDDLAPIVPEDRVRYISRRREGRAQFLIEVRQDGVYIRDGGSTGGTYVGGQRAVDWTKITPEDVVNLAGAVNIKIICQVQ